MPPERKRLAALVLGVALIALFAIIVLTRGHVGEGSEPSEGVAEVQGVDDGVVTQEEFDTALQRVSDQQGLKKVPSEDDPQYELLRDQALGEALLPRWIRGEAEDRGVTVEDDEIADRTDQIVEQNFGNPKEFEKFVTEQGFCSEEELSGGADPTECAGVQQEVRVMLLAEQIQESILGSDPEEAAAAVPAEDVGDYYEENISQFEVPETRDVRVIQNEDEEKVEQAIAELEQDDSPENWKAVAEQYSQDPVSKDKGGLLEGVVEGQSPGGPAFDEAVFGAGEGELVGPIETDQGFYAAQVEKINPAETTPQSEVEEQIRQQLSAQEQEQAAAEFESDFIAKWTEQTVCDEEIANDRCVNFEAPPPQTCTEEQAAQGCPAPVTLRKPVAPGAGSSDPLTTLAQGPLPPPTEAAAPPAGLPPGAAPIPGAPPGAAPPGAAPPGAVPPGAAPPAAPPGAAPPAAPPGAAPPGAVPPGAAPPGGAPVPPAPPPGG
jgi:parvulin-like peptidyl-prolyl isomerase